MNKYYLKVFGCAMNYSDSEKIAAWYEEKGWQSVKNVEEADEVVIVTCSVRQTAEDRVYGLVNNLTKIKSQNAKGKIEIQNSKVKKPKIILTGCMMRYPLKFLKEKLPDVDEFKRISEYILNTKHLTFNTNRSALVPIMEGCNNFCSYCVVPYARGREVSRPFKEIVCEVEELAKKGCKEIMLLGQNVNSYNSSSKLQCKIQKLKTPFARLLAVLHGIEGIEKISFLTSNPWDLDDDIIEAMSLPKVDRYLHLPVQSGDDEMLRWMNRHYTAADFLKLVKKIRKKIPDIQIGTDIIVGFPGETEKQFQNTVDLCKKIGFVKAYVSMYSPRLQTAAYKLIDDVSHKEKRRRWNILDEQINRKPKGVI